MLVTLSSTIRTQVHAIDRALLPSQCSCSYQSSLWFGTAHAQFLVQACGKLALILCPPQHYARTFAYFLFLNTDNNGLSALPGVTFNTFFFLFSSTDWLVF